VTTGFYLDLTPPTDARPFFFNELRFATLFDPNLFSHFTHTGVFAGNLIATLTLAMLVLISVALVASTIVVPLRSTVREAGWQLAIGGRPVGGRLTFACTPRLYCHTQAKVVATLLLEKAANLVGGGFAQLHAMRRLGDRVAHVTPRCVRYTWACINGNRGS